MPIKAFKSLLDPEYLSRIEPFTLMARTAVEGFLSGLHRSVLQGFGSEFLQYRHYTPGEDLKYVDWKLYARRDRLHTKVFQEETHMNVHIVLDASASMDYRGSRAIATKLRYATMVAACLAYLACRQGDNASLLCYRRRIESYIEPGHRNQQLQRILLSLARTRAEGEADHAVALDFLENHISNRGLVIFMSDMLEDDGALARRMGRLRLRHCDCIALQVLDPDEQELPHSESARFEDMESGAEVLTSPRAIATAHDRKMTAFIQRLRDGFHREQVDFLTLNSRDHLGHALAAYLHHRERSG